MQWIYRVSLDVMYTVVKIIEKMLRWFGHVMRRNGSEAVRVLILKLMMMEIEGEEDQSKCELVEERVV